ncbi:hypothetical protein L195_g037914 [Trifolium pratense]|uniref:Uncharacterized protein n=1 Tax=Trifolium pratense TaxID=57577 RepID=A0A2K3LTQ5_TRIPR|nr:hypothetical protein L195_g037914 [Trifolium pratense]
MGCWFWPWRVAPSAPARRATISEDGWVSKANIKTMVNRVTSWEDSRVGETFYHLGNVIEFLGHGKKFGTWVEFGNYYFL